MLDRLKQIRMPGGTKSKRRSLYWRIYWSVHGAFLQPRKRKPLLLLACAFTLLPTVFLVWRTSNPALRTQEGDAGIQPDNDQYETITSLRNKLWRNETTCVEVMQSYVERIQREDAKISSILWHRPSSDVLTLAKKLDRMEWKRRRPLFCVPIVVKDNLDTTFLPTTAGSKALKDMPNPSHNAAVVKRLQNNHAIILGKANMDEFALGYKTLSTLGIYSLHICINAFDTSSSLLGRAFKIISVCHEYIGGQTRNPFARSFSPGGSSGGSAAAVASNFAVVGIGTDTGGSIRIPSSFNNLVGLRPTQGLVSVDGVVPLSHSRDTVGPMARSAEDASIVMDAIVAKQTRKLLVSPLEFGEVQIQQLRSCVGGGKFQLMLHQSRIGVLDSLLGSTKGIKDIVLQAVKRMEEKGAKVLHITRGIATKKTLSKYKSSSFWEFADDLAEYLKGRTVDTTENTKLPLDLNAVVKVKWKVVYMYLICLSACELYPLLANSKRHNPDSIGQEAKVRQEQAAN